MTRLQYFCDGISIILVRNDFPLQMKLQWRVFLIAWGKEITALICTYIDFRTLSNRHQWSIRIIYSVFCSKWKNIMKNTITNAVVVPLSCRIVARSISPSPRLLKELNILQSLYLDFDDFFIDRMIEVLGEEYVKVLCLFNYYWLRPLYFN